MQNFEIATTITRWKFETRNSACCKSAKLISVGFGGKKLVRLVFSLNSSKERTRNRSYFRDEREKYVFFILKTLYSVYRRFENCTIVPLSKMQGTITYSKC